MSHSPRLCNRRAFLGRTLASSLLLPCLTRGAPAATAGPSDLGPVLTPVLREHGLPAVAAAVMKDGALLASGAVGVRKLGNPAAVSVADKFHIGSCTKAMTATLAAMWIEEGKLRWNQTLEETFPERVARMNPKYRSVTLDLLLTHRSGAPANNNDYGDPLAPMPAQRLHYMDTVTRKEPEAEPGSRYIYSNAGYIMAGAMMERASGLVWEELMRTRLFRPLGMTTAGFGPPCPEGEVSQPWGHVFEDGRFEPRHGDNPPALGPAGTVHCSLQDYLKFADQHTAGGARPPRLLKPESFARLHEPAPGQPYARGWVATDRGWGHGRVLTHTGSNTMNFFVVWLAPKLGLSFVAAANAAGGKVPEYLDSVVGALVKQFAI